MGERPFSEVNASLDRLRQCRDQLASYPHNDQIPAAWQRETVAWACYRIAELEARERELVEMVVSAYHEGFIDGANSEHPSPQSDSGWAQSDTREALAKHKAEKDE